MIDSLKRTFISFGCKNNLLFVLVSENDDLPVFEHVLICGHIKMTPFTEKYHRFIFPISFPNSLI